METKDKKTGETAKVESKTGAAETQTDNQQSEAAKLPETTIEHLDGEISRLADKIFEVNPDASMGGEHGGAVDVACGMLDQLQSALSANEASQSRIAELETALGKAKAENDNAAQKIAKLEAGVTVTIEPAPEIEIKRPKVGVELKFGKKAVNAAKVIDALNEGDLFQVVLADSSSHVAPAKQMLGSGAMLLSSGTDDEPQLTLLDRIEIADGDPSARVREAWLLDANGHALSKCRLSVDLVGGGGLTAAIPAKSIVFRFEQPVEQTA